MTYYIENVNSLSISEGIKGVRILIVNKYGEQVELLTKGNTFKQVK